MSIDIKAQTLNYDLDEDYILRRLGGAVVAQWALLGREVRSRLVDQAVAMIDREPTTELKQHVEEFIASHQADLEVPDYS